MRASKLNLIPYGRQCISSLEIEEVVKVMKSDWITQGPKIEEFESALAQYCGSKYAVAVSSGTAALHLACLATGLKKGDEAVTSPITFLATSNAVVYSNAQPKFADIQIKDGNIDPEKIKKILTKKTKVLLPVCFSGFPTDIVKISKIAKKNHLTIIEDACHALGAKYKVNGKWNSVGSCRHSDMTVFSFHPVKHITTGEGGAITTNSAHLYEKLKILRNHGIYRDIKMMKRQPWNYEMRELGFNYRLTDFQCALGIAQLKRLNKFIKQRRNIAKEYDKAFRNIEEVDFLEEPENTLGSYHLYVIRVNFRKYRTSRTEFMKALKKKGILTQVHYIPIYRQPYYVKNFFSSPRDFPQTEKYYQQCLSLPIFPSMANKDVHRVIKAVKDCL